ncbi:transglycosylase SLT domain-containing protein [Massilia sp. PAMC28688]|uniref:transglycosylase SLT domain-containing protein n=1 Tax=Massilia sp. PAMC28688 TaxID=2861283 RepID=UPI001E2B25EF|nr:transglycosylase SLT domain-containing protein [Massilia sp. PAMC28688]
MAARPVTWSAVAKTARGVATTAQHTLTFVGLSALAVIGVLYARPDMAQQLSQVLAPAPAPVMVAQAAAPVDVSGITQAAAPAAASTPAAPALSQDKASASDSRQQRYVTNWLAKRYRVANDATNMLVSTAYVTASETKLDPLLILAVMAIESGLNPFAESPVGAQGLMQVMSKIHHDKFKPLGGTQAALNPVANIRVGAQILKEYVKRGGSVEAGLKKYVGAAAFETDQGYGSKVLAEYRRLKLVASGKHVPTFTRPAPAAPAAAPAAIVADKAAPADAPKAESAPVVPEGEQLALQ